MTPNDYARPITPADRALMSYFGFRVLPVYAPILEVVRRVTAAGKKVNGPEVARIIGVKGTAPIYYTRNLIKKGLLQAGPVPMNRPRATSRGRPLYLTEAGKALLAANPYTPEA